MREKRFNLANRLLHWSIAFTILFLLLTVFLRSTWMDKNQIGDIVKNNLNKSNINLTDKDAANIGRAVRRPMWQCHIYAGYVMIGLYVIRMIVTAIQGIAYKNPFTKGLSFKEKLKSWIYIIFYFLLTITLFTGFMVENGPKAWKDSMEFIHVKSLYFFIAFIIVHIVGVMIADAKEDRGIISKIITGDEA